MKKWLKAQRWEATDTGWLLTLVIFALVQWAGFQPANNSNYANKFTEFAHLKPSEMGDTLAGIFAALAFVWIIVTVAMQSMELSEQRKEFAKMATAQAGQFGIMKQQAELAMFQHDEHVAQLNGEVFEAKIEELDRHVSDLFRSGILLRLQDGTAMKVSPEKWIFRELNAEVNLDDLNVKEKLDAVVKSLLLPEVAWKHSDPNHYPSQLFRVWKLVSECEALQKKVDRRTQARNKFLHLWSYLDILDPEKEWRP